MTDNSAVDDQSHARIELTRFDIDRILHFAHPIPWKHGWHQRHLDDHHGEWDWNDMMAMLRHAEVLIDRPGGPALSLETQEAHGDIPDRCSRRMGPQRHRR